MARAERRLDAALRRIGDEVRDARLAAGLNQTQLGSAASVSRSQVSRLEAARARHVPLAEVIRIAAVLGLDLSVRLYPSGDPLRDGAHAARLQRLLSHIAPPLTCRREVPLPPIDGRQELRAWDCVLRGSGLRTAIELEMRLHDTQALERRIALKRRDDPTDRFVLVVADTKGNRRVLAANPTTFADLPRLGPSRIVRALEAGEHPPTCLVVL
jgi:transcriptional regulator with XRE-family HTH domain